MGERKKPRKFSFLRFLPLFVLFVSISTFSTNSDFKTASLNENETQLEGVILLIWQRRLSPFFTLIFRHKPELILHPQIYISRDPIHFISILISRRVEPIDLTPCVRSFITGTAASVYAPRLVNLPPVAISSRPR